MFYVVASGKSRQFGTLREACIYYESFDADAAVLSPSDYVFRVRRNKIEIVNGAVYTHEGIAYSVDDIDDLADEAVMVPLGGGAARRVSFAFAEMGWVFI